MSYLFVFLAVLAAGCSAYSVAQVTAMRRELDMRDAVNGGNDGA